MAQRPLETEIAAFAKWQDDYDQEVLQGNKENITVVRGTFQVLADTFFREAGRLEATLARFPQYAQQVEETRKFHQSVYKMDELAQKATHQEFNLELHNWRSSKAPMTIFNQLFLTVEPVLVTATMTQISRNENRQEEDGTVIFHDSKAIDGTFLPCEEEKIWSCPELDALDAAEAIEQQEFATKFAGILANEGAPVAPQVSLKTILKVETWTIPKIPPEKGFLRHHFETVGPGMRRFSGGVESQTSFVTFWDDWKEKIHRIHPKLASASDKLIALNNQLDYPARYKTEVFIYSSDKEAYWRALRDLFNVYGNLDQEKYRSMQAMRNLRPLDEEDPEKIEEFFDQVRKIRLRMLNMEMEPAYVTRECMFTLHDKMPQAYLDEFCKHIGVRLGGERSYFMNNPVFYFQKMSDWFYRYIKKYQGAAAPITKRADPNNMFQLLAAPVQQVPMADVKEEDTPLSEIISGVTQMKSLLPKEENCLATRSKGIASEHVGSTSENAAAVQVPGELAKTLIVALEEFKKQKLQEKQGEQPNETQAPPAGQKRAKKGKLHSSQNNGEGEQAKKQKGNKKGTYCRFHDANGHRQNQCTMTRDEKLQALHQRNICANCQMKGHVVTACRNNNTCHHCAGDQTNKHMTILCPVGPRGQPQQANPGANAADGAAGANANGGR